MKILIVEDEPTLRSSLADHLRRDGYRCEEASTYAQAHEKIKLYHYDCVLVDLTLPGGTGLGLVRTLKADNSPAGVLILSARGALDDKVKGLELGADDYLTKPFHLAELTARLHAILRRRQFQGHNVVRFRDLTVLPDRAQVLVGGNLVPLTRKEYELLLYFLTNPNRLLTKESIAEHLWGDAADTADSFDFIYNHLKNLRKKLQEQGAPDYIRTVYGLGYELHSE
ncbi:response regulator transcription factor [Hymenobacter ginsengisoli]|uniref:Response regulator transcription factor n=1 Tax=Hymenobacter ginsengisoli TaxID=1051626 RepID=A0ABP8QHP1_9BACT|nr:response regulator transcription factor [Hymenobacter sp. KCTC 23674]MBO2029868.1 response regulator transcription factor [Hymenobacter sp. BT559]